MPSKSDCVAELAPVDAVHEMVMLVGVVLSSDKPVGVAGGLVGVVSVVTSMRGARSLSPPALTALTLILYRVDAVRPVNWYELCL